MTEMTANEMIATFELELNNEEDRAIIDYLKQIDPTTHEKEIIRLLKIALQSNDTE